MSGLNSQKIFQRAKELMPGGVNSPARAFGAVGGNPIVMERASGPFLYDVDGNEYLDYVLSWGPMILGHAHPDVTRALQEAVTQGTSFGAPTEKENLLAELVISLVPGVEKLRLVNSGTEATMSAIRLARGYTGRDKIIKFVGNYHGHVDSLLVAAGSAAATFSVPNSPGVTAGTAQDTLLVSYNDVEAVRDVFARQGEQIAGVIVEPVAGNMGCVPASFEFLSTLRDVTQQYRSVLIFDEVMTGFRVSLGGAQQYYGITPDLTTLGKVIGGGLPVGAYGGRAEIMNHVLPEGKVFQAGTLSGNPLATTAGIVTLSRLKQDAAKMYRVMETHVQQLVEESQALGKAYGLHLNVQHAGTMFTFFFLGDQDEAVTNWESASRCDTAKYARFFQGLLLNHVYFPCSQFEATFMSTAHTSEHIAQTLDAVKKTLSTF